MFVVERQDTQFRVVTRGFSTDWWKDTPSNRKGMVVFLRRLKDEDGHPLFTYDQLAQVVGSVNRQAAHEHMQEFEERGGDIGAFLPRKRKVDGEVAVAVEAELEGDVWVGMEALAERVNSRLGREDLTASNMVPALDQVSGRKVRRWFLRVVARGEAHYKEGYVLSRLFGWVSSGIGKEALGGAEGVWASLEEATEPLGAEALELTDKGAQVQERLLESQEVTEEGLASLWESALGWVILAFALYMQGVSLSVIGGWLGVDKSTVFRRLRKAGVWESKVWKAVGKLFRTRDKRTVRRRVARLVSLVEEMGKGEVVSGLVAKLSQVLPAVGSTWRPSTANGVERFFGVFDRFYLVKGPFCDLASAQKHLQLFVLWYLLRVGAQGQACPLERAGGQVAQLPLYHLLNRPKVRMLRERMAQQYRQAA